MTGSPVYYAVGDVHGRDDLLAQMHERIAAMHGARHARRRGVIVHLGDYVDRGPWSKKVVDRLIKGLPGFDFVCLKGNHEAMMLSYIETGDAELGLQWLLNGGQNTVESYGESCDRGLPDAARLRHAVGKKHLKWLASLPLYYETDHYFFVHAGVLPDRPLAEQKEKDMLWIRHAFLESTEDYGRCVVHGHSPADAPEVRANRINLDTGAVWTGRLSCAALDGAAEPRLLIVDGPRIEDLRRG